MKRILLCITLLAALFTTGCGSTQSTKVAPQDNTPITGDTVSMTVYGMSCPLCATNLDKQLAKIAGVRDVSVNLEFGLITIGIDPNNPPSRARLNKAVIDSGFTFVKFE